MKIAITARNFSDQNSLDILRAAGFEMLDLPAEELGMGAGAEALLR